MLTTKPSVRNRIAEELKIRELRRAVALPAASAKAVKPATKAEDLTPQLEAAFRAGGMSEAEAKIAARARARPPAQTLFEAAIEGGMSKAQAATFARGRSGIHEAVTKTEPASGGFKGGDFPPADYAYVGDREDPETWALLLTLVPGGMPDPDSVKAAAHAIDPANPAPNPVPPDAIADVKAALVNAWTKAGLPADEMPAILTTEALMRAFVAGGLSERAARIAATGRGRI